MNGHHKHPCDQVQIYASVPYNVADDRQTLMEANHQKKLKGFHNDAENLSLDAHYTRYGSKSGTSHIP